MLLPVVVWFSVACSAFPTSEDGAQCLTRCYIESSFHNVSEDVSDAKFVEGHNEPNSLIKPVSFSLSKSDVCEQLSSFRACSKSCPRAREDAVVKQIVKVAQKECSSSVSEEQREKFLQSYHELDNKLADGAKRCEDPALEDDEALCKNAASCLLGSALDELKSDYPKDVVTVVADARKLLLTFALKDPKSPPEACSILYEPYKA